LVPALQGDGERLVEARRAGDGLGRAIGIGADVVEARGTPVGAGAVAGSEAGVLVAVKGGRAEGPGCVRER